MDMVIKHDIVFNDVPGIPNGSRCIGYGNANPNKEEKEKALAEIGEMLYKVKMRGSKAE